MLQFLSNGPVYAWKLTSEHRIYQCTELGEDMGEGHWVQFIRITWCQLHNIQFVSKPNSNFWIWCLEPYMASDQGIWRTLFSHTSLPGTKFAGRDILDYSINHLLSSWERAFSVTAPPPRELHLTSSLLISSLLTFEESPHSWSLGGSWRQLITMAFD